MSFIIQHLLQLWRVIFRIVVGETNTQCALKPNVASGWIFRTFLRGSPHETLLLLCDDVACGHRNIQISGGGLVALVFDVRASLLKLLPR